jgi:hypothetical protein
MEYKHLGDGRTTTLTGSVGEFQLLGEGLKLIRLDCDDAEARGTTPPWQVDDYLDGLEARAAACRTADPEQIVDAPVDRDGLMVLCAGLRLAMNHAHKTETVLDGQPAGVCERLQQKRNQYGDLRKQLLPGVRYDKHRA